MNEEDRIEALREKAEEAELNDLIHSLTKNHSLSEKIITNIFSVLFISFILIGPASVLLYFFCMGASSVGLHLASSNIEFPLGEIKDMAIDKHQRLVCYTRFHHRIQIYTTDGEFLNGWFVDASTHGVNIDIDDNNNIHVMTHGDIHYVFAFGGKFISKEKGNGFYNPFKNYNRNKNRENKDAQGNSYYYREKIFRTQIIKVTPLEEEIIIATEPFYALPFRLPFPGFLFVILTAIIMALLKVFDRKTKKKAIATALTDNSS